MFKLKRESLGRSTSIFLGLTIGIDLSDSIVNTSELQYPVGERDILLTSPDSLPLSYRRLVGAKASKPGSRDKNPTYCYDLNVEMCLCVM